MVLTAPSTVANAAPDSKPVVAEDEAPKDDAQAIARARELVALGYARFELADYDGAIDFWEQAYPLLPISMRGQLTLPLANAHFSAYDGDKDREHLRKAAVLFNDYLATLDDDDETRTSVEAALAHVEAELERIDAEQTQHVQELAERDSEQRDQHTELEHRAPVDTWTTQDQRRFRIHVAVGGTLTGLGVASLTAMAVGAALGQSVDRTGARLVTDPSASTEQIQQLRREGTAYNQLAWTTGAIGGALVITGGALLIVAVVERKRGRSSLGAHLRPGLSGLELRF